MEIKEYVATMCNRIVVIGKIKKMQEIVSFLFYRIPAIQSIG